MEADLDSILELSKSGQELTVSERRLVQSVLQNPHSLELYTAIQIVGQARISSMLGLVRDLMRHESGSDDDDENDMIRRVSVQVVGMLGSNHDLGDILDSATDKSPYVRMAAVTALGDIGLRSVESKSRVAKFLLDKFRTEPDRLVAESIYSSMRVLLGESALSGAVELRMSDIENEILERIEVLSKSA